MAHELEIQANGKASMFFAGEVPWHGLGTRLEGKVTSADAIKAAGLDWKVGKKDLFTCSDGYKIDEKVSHQATYRETDGKILGVVKKTWTPLQNADAFEFFDTFVNAGQAEYETAGSLRDGTRIWVLVRLTGDPLVIVPKSDDTVRKFLLISNSHDGTLAVRCGFTPIRVVCANTMAMAHGDEASNLVKIHHHGNVKDALAKVGEVMNVVNRRFEATAVQYRELAAHGCSEDTLKKYVNLVFAGRRVKTAAKMDLEAVYGADVAQARAEERAAKEFNSRVYPKIAELFEAGRGNALEGVKGTLWAGYNAIAEYLVHERGKDAGARLESAWFGQGHAQNALALKVGMELAGA